VYGDNPVVGLVVKIIFVPTHAELLGLEVMDAIGLANTVTIIGQEVETTLLASVTRN
jgi:hypothetical protein